MNKEEMKKTDTPQDKNEADNSGKNIDNKRPVEIGGPKGPEPTRYGDWEKKGRCVDF